MSGREGRGLLTEPQWDSIARHLRFSRRETEVVQHIFEGHKESAIAYYLGISAHTVHTHVERIYRKAGARSRCELVVRIFAAYLSIEDNGRVPAVSISR